MGIPREVVRTKRGKKGKFCRGCGTRYSGAGGRGPMAAEARGDKDGITTIWRCRTCGVETRTWRPYPDGV